MVKTKCPTTLVPYTQNFIFSLCYPLQIIALSRFTSSWWGHDSTVRQMITERVKYALRKRISIFGSLEDNSFAAAAQEGKSPRSSLIKWILSFPVACFNFSIAGNVLDSLRAAK